jgi:hypothetical protein
MAGGNRLLSDRLYRESLWAIEQTYFFSRYDLPLFCSHDQLNNDRSIRQSVASILVLLSVHQTQHLRAIAFCFRSRSVEDLLLSSKDVEA